MEKNNHIYRFEVKYEIPTRIIGRLEADIKNFGMDLDKNCLINGGYHVASLYFDSYDFSNYQDKAGGFLKRKKLRARIYESYLDKSEVVWFEIKKKYDIKNTKIRLKLNREEWERFIKKGPSALLTMDRGGDELKAKNEIFSDLIGFSLKPKVVVRYWRRALLNKFKDLRITFDSNLAACKKTDLGYNGFATQVNKNMAVMEVKYNHIMPFWLKEIIKNYNLKRDAYSKYALSLEALYRHNPLSR